MTIERAQWTESFTASADLSAKQYYGVKMHTVAMQVALNSSNKDRVIGVLQNKPKSGEPAEVALHGIRRALGWAAIQWKNEIVDTPLNFKGIICTRLSRVGFATLCYEQSSQTLKVSVEGGSYGVLGTTGATGPAGPTGPTGAVGATGA